MVANPAAVHHAFEMASASKPKLPAGHSVPVIPETTSAEACWNAMLAGNAWLPARGPGLAWDIKAWILALPLTVDTMSLPSVSEPFLAWTTSGEVDFPGAGREAAVDHAPDQEGVVLSHVGRGAV